MTRSVSLAAIPKRLAGMALWWASRLYLSAPGSRRKRVLLWCNTPATVDYLLQFWHLLREDERIHFTVSILDGAVASDRILARLQSIPQISPRIARALAWDLIVFSDHGAPSFLKMSPSVYIGHGPKCKVYGDTTYAYSQNAFDAAGRPFYTTIFAETEMDRDRALVERPMLRDRITVVGNLESDRVLEHRSARDKYRSQFGFNAEDVVVLILSTWGPYGLWNVMGEALLDEVRNLSSRFKFILAPHPLEFQQVTGVSRVWGNYIRDHKPDGVLMRDRGESWIPYMVASDIVLADSTGLIEYAVLLHKRVIVTPVPRKELWTGSVVAKARDFAPELDDARRLHHFLTDAESAYPVEELERLARLGHPHPGEAADKMRQAVYSILGLPTAVRN